MFNEEDGELAPDGSDKTKPRNKRSEARGLRGTRPPILIGRVSGKTQATTSAFAPAARRAFLIMERIVSVGKAPLLNQ